MTLRMTFYLLGARCPPGPLLLHPASLVITCWQSVLAAAPHPNEAFTVKIKVF